MTKWADLSEEEKRARARAAQAQDHENYWKQKNSPKPVKTGLDWLLRGKRN